jgi:hypothetical protein
MIGGRQVKTGLVKSANGRFTASKKRKKKTVKQKKDMAKELEKYKADSVYLLNKLGGLIRIYINSLDDYDHFQFNLHHFIPYEIYAGNEKWYEERGIKQKLILMSKKCHEHVHDTGIKTLSDAQFERKYKIKRSMLIFSKKGDY